MVKKIVLNPKTDGEEHLFPKEIQEEFEEPTSYDENGKRKMIINGHSYELVSTDPYGLWHIKMGHGGHLPPVLQGQFTGQSDAEKAIEAYESGRKSGEHFHA